MAEKPRSWLPSEDDVLRSASAIGEAMEKLPHRSRAAIKTRKAALRIHWPGLAPYTPAEDRVIRSAIGMEDARTKLPHRSRPSIASRKKMLGVSWTVTMVPLPGERWADVPGLDFRVSSMGRAARIATGRELKVMDGAQRKGYLPFIQHYRDGVLSSISLPRALVLAFGLHAKDGMRWSAAEEATLRASKSAEEAADRIGRSASACSRRLRFLRLPQWSERAPPERTNGEALWRMAKKVVPAHLPEHIRQDLVSDMLVARLEGDERPWAALYKEALKRHNALVGAFKEKSASATFGDSDLTLLDTFADDVERF